MTENLFFAAAIGWALMLSIAAYSLFTPDAATAQQTTTNLTATTTVAGNATNNATSSTSSSSCTYNTTAAGLDDSMNLQGALAPDRIAGLCAQDPEFARWQETFDMCQGYNLPVSEMHRNNATMSYDQCVSMLQTSVDRWCDLAIYQKEKCETAGNQLSTFTAFHDIKELLAAP
jgi:hypothetical protein